MAQSEDCRTADICVAAPSVDDLESFCNNPGNWGSGLCDPFGPGAGGYGGSSGASDAGGSRPPPTEAERFAAATAQYTNEDAREVDGNRYNDPAFRVSGRSSPRALAEGVCRFVYSAAAAAACYRLGGGLPGAVGCGWVAGEFSH